MSLRSSCVPARQRPWDRLRETLHSLATRRPPCGRRPDTPAYPRSAGHSSCSTPRTLSISCTLSRCGVDVAATTSCPTSSISSWRAVSLQLVGRAAADSTARLVGGVHLRLLGSRCRRHSLRVRAGHRADILSAPRHHVAMPKRSARPTKPSPVVVEVPVRGPDGVDEQGAFAFAICPVCGWRGPGRRSRDRARKDLGHHDAEDAVHAGRASGALTRSGWHVGPGSASRRRAARSGVCGTRGYRGPTPAQDIPPAHERRSATRAPRGATGWRRP